MIQRNELKKKIRELIETELNVSFYATFFGDIEVMLSDMLNEIEAEYEKKEKKEEAIDREFKTKMAVAIHDEFSSSFDSGEYAHIEKRLVEELSDIANKWFVKKGETK